MGKLFQSIILVLCLFTIQTKALPVFAASRGIIVVSKEGKSIGLYNDYHAIVIGISDYDYWPDLPNAVKDAQEVRTQLEKMGFTVSLTLDPDAQKLRSILTHAYYDLGKEKDRALLIYFQDMERQRSLQTAHQWAISYPRIALCRIKTVWILIIWQSV